MKMVKYSEQLSRLKILYVSVNRPIFITYIFFSAYKLYAFTFYMEWYDFISYAAVVFISYQALCLFIAISLLLLTCAAEKVFSKKTHPFELTEAIVKSGGYAVSLFAFIFSIERIFIEQTWLSAANITPVWRAIIEMLFGVALFLTMTYRGTRTFLKQHATETSSSDPRADADTNDQLNRRLFLASSASAIAAASVGSRVVLGNRFDFPSVNSSSISLTENKNILLVTFDALSATDMSLYGYGLNTTPNIDLFAETSDVHDRFYSCSTYTTPGIATILTGRYPSRSGIYHLGGMLHNQEIYRTLPAILKNAGYKTASIFGNPYAMPLMGSTHGAFDHLIAAPRAGWSNIPPSELMEVPGTIDMIDLGSRIRTVSGLVVPAMQQIFSETPPEATFEAAKALISDIQEPFFVWVHVMAPHAPFLPSEEFRHRFLKAGILETRQDMLHPRIVNRSRSAAQIQTDIEHLRLRYDEWVTEADHAFGNFIRFMKDTGKLNKTMTVVSADHGEFFAPDSYGHAGSTLHKSLIHIPMIVKMPNQKTGRRISSLADQTSVAPSILNFAGLPIPDWMEGVLLQAEPQSHNTNPNHSDLAVTQYFARNSKFEPITTGTIGAVTAKHQYVRTLATGEEKLFSLSNPTTGDHLERERVDIKADMPDDLADIREQLRSRFPEVNI